AFYPWRGSELMDPHPRPGPPMEDPAAHAQTGDPPFERDCVFLQDAAAHGGAAVFARRVQQFEGWQNIAAAPAPRLGHARLAHAGRRGFFLIERIFVALVI